MPALHVRDVPESVITALRERAQSHGRSMQEEIRRILARAAAEPAEVTSADRVRLITVSTGGTSTWSREELYGDEGC
ncbi:MAG: FitA-like ribbon-helix-helix domain-containing protein [Sporichthyaceae bacterium]